MTPERTLELLKMVDDDAIKLMVTLDRDTYAAIYEAAQPYNLKMADMIQSICKMYVEHLEQQEPNGTD